MSEGQKLYEQNHVAQNKSNIDHIQTKVDGNQMHI